MAAPKEQLADVNDKREDAKERRSDADRMSELADTEKAAREGT